MTIHDCMSQDRLFRPMGLYNNGLVIVSVCPPMNKCIYIPSVAIVTEAQPHNRGQAILYNYLT